MYLLALPSGRHLPHVNVQGSKKLALYNMTR